MSKMMYLVSWRATPNSAANFLGVTDDENYAREFVLSKRANAEAGQWTWYEVVQDLKVHDNGGEA